MNKVLTINLSATKLAFLLLSGLLFLMQGCSMLPDMPSVPRVPGMDRLTGDDGMFRDRQSEYLEAETIPRIQVPEGLDSYIIDDLMIVPEINTTQTEAFLQTPRPRPIEGRSDREVVIQRIEDTSWIIVDASPSQVWPRIRDYWTQSGIELAFENPSRGILDTGWFVLEGNVLTKEKFRVTVEPGFQDNSSEIRLKHMSLAQATPVFNQVNWPDESMDPVLEYDMLSSLSTYLVDVADLYQASSVSFLAGAIPSGGKATLATTPGGIEIMRLDADLTRSWAAVGRALERAEITVVAESKEQGVYEVDYALRDPEAEEEDGPGLLKKIGTLNGLFSKQEIPDVYPLRVQLIDTGSVVEVLVDLINEDTSLEAEAARSALLREIRSIIA